ncbi:hypothetical protein SAMN05216282_104230 [Cryobacterium psychrotolerans]|uniref:Uncharacterized protein n=1 Tax=Cryobacterium psychrotolerans TaxID=386301 RepID=A0A1G9AS09_9MICO|nr:hypothetical protein [Cryobacterium psychrotolerans]TFD89554.1 hypothetical protein E3T56_02395 [Cryobacterium psychrotolerans]SDK30043.1 hypothetical protein SAMN05216282_104230 [Cryobacterium psychrotolerans]
MGLSNEQQLTLVGELDQRLRREAELASVFAAVVPGWYGRLLSSLILATGNAHVLYLSASYLLEGSAFSLNAVLFTNKLYVRATVTGTQGTESGDRAEPSVTALSRSSLTSMRLSCDHDAFDQTTAWPGSIRLTLFFARDLAVSLPLGAARTESGDAELHALVTTSRASLER